MHSSTITCATLGYGLEFFALAIFDEEPEAFMMALLLSKVMGNLVHDLKRRW